MDGTVLVGGMDDHGEEIQEEWDKGEDDEEHKQDIKDGAIFPTNESKARDEGHTEEMEGRKNKESDSTGTPDEATRIDEDEKFDCKGEKADVTQDVSRKEDGIEEGSEKASEDDKAEDGDDETEVCRW